LTPPARPAQSSQPRRDCEETMRFVTEVALNTAAELGPEGINVTGGA
jgi:hypothetical protein